MWLRMIVSMAGPYLSVSPGDIVEWDDFEAPRLIAAGYASEFDGLIVDGVAYEQEDLDEMTPEELAELGVEQEPVEEAISEAQEEAPVVEAPATPAPAPKAESKSKKKAKK